MKLMILDGNSVINRAYFGVKPLTTRDGLYTHAVYGFLNILERIPAACRILRQAGQVDRAMEPVPAQWGGGQLSQPITF